MLLRSDAKSAWVTFHDTVERELASGGELHDVRDVASKAADNAARLAALFHFFELGMGERVGLEAVESASRIVAWHLNESHRFFGELALPAEMANGMRLDKWLIDHCRRNGLAAVPIRKIQQYGPAGLRDKAALDAAVRYLEELNRVRLIPIDKRKDLYVNPKLLMEKS
jgi:putative DNA primase/helicase